MSRRHRVAALGVCLGALVFSALSAAPSSAYARTSTVGHPERATQETASGWCGEGFETLPSDVCYIDGRTKGPRKTLVIWLHGVIGKDTNWSWNHQRMLQRLAKHHNIEILFPKAPASGTVYAWPGTAEAQARTEQALIDQWTAAKNILEERERQAFEEVFVFGFSSGAYFASSLAMRGRLDVDGYATFAGGQSHKIEKEPVVRFAPVYVGVCAKDSTTEKHSRAFAKSLSAAGIPRMVSVQQVGHDLSEAHFAGALAFLRSKRKVATV